MPVKHIIIEGIDHIGKDTLINQLQNCYGGFIIHSEKPKRLKLYKTLALNQFSKILTSNEVYKTDGVTSLYLPEYLYQCDYFNTIFRNMNFLSSQVPFIYNRLHLGEYVYGALYRNYTEEMRNKVFELEQMITDNDNVYLIQLLMHNPKRRAKDDDAFANDNGEAEQKLFQEAFEKSGIRHKKIIYVDNVKNWKAPKKIFNEVIEFLN